MKYTAKFLFLFLLSGILLDPAFGSDPGNVPSDDNSDCESKIVYRNSQPTDKESKRYLTGEDRVRTCSDPSDSSNVTTIYRSKRYAHYVVWEAEKWEVYYGGENCPADVDLGKEERDANNPFKYSREVVLDIDCPYGGSDGGGGGDDCMRVHEGETPGPVSSEYLDLTLTEKEPVEDSDLPIPDGLNIIYERLILHVPRPGYWPFDFDYSMEPDVNEVTYLTSTYETVQSGCTTTWGEVLPMSPTEKQRRRRSPVRLATHTGRMIVNMLTSPELPLLARHTIPRHLSRIRSALCRNSQTSFLGQPVRLDR